MISNSELRINSERFKKDFEELSSIGRDPGGGLQRTAFSPAHMKARAWLKAKALESGLQHRVDGASNQIIRLPAEDPGAPIIMMGSHLDSVPDGGVFDGALGVLGALEVLRIVREHGLSLPVTLEAVDFSDEEGTLVSFLGSAAMAGRLTPEMLANPRGDSQALKTGLKMAGISEQSIMDARRDPAHLLAFIELHVEQSDRLENASARIGIVNRINGIGFFQVSFIGLADHAGSAPMETRRDASLGASDFILRARSLVMGDFPACLVNVGDAVFLPGKFNIIPRRVNLSVEYRSTIMKEHESLAIVLQQTAQECAERFNLDIEILPLGGGREPYETAPEIQQAVQLAAKSLELETITLHSGPGHDAQMISHLCPSGMIFVPSLHGHSHSPLEESRMEDCIHGVNTLLQSVLRLACS